MIYDLIKKKELKSAINVKLNIIIAIHICTTHSHLTRIIQTKQNINDLNQKKNINDYYISHFNIRIFQLIDFILFLKNH